MQANGIGSTGYVFGTITVGTIANGFRDHWRLGLLVILPIVAYLYFVRRDKTLKSHVPSEHGPQNGKLSIKFWVAWLGFVAVISSEFATSFWAAALVRDRTHASPAISTLAIVALGTGMGIGRWFGAQALRNFEPDTQLKIFITTQFVGFAILWFSHNLTISIAAILIVGLGISSQFALSSIRLIGLSDGRPDLAIGKSSMAAGLAIGGAPFALGLLGDHLGISRAYMMVPILIVIAFLIVQFIPSHVHIEDEL
jgi:predicted MFS family arabinose efflux permease